MDDTAEILGRYNNDIEERAEVCMNLMSSLVAACDSLGFEMKILKDPTGKRVAQVFTHPSGCNMAEAGCWVATLRKQCTAFLDKIGFVEGEE